MDTAGKSGVWERGRSAREQVESVREALRECEIDSAEAEALTIIEHVLGVSRAQLRLWIAVDESSLVFTEEQRARLQAAVERRCAREPLQHILGTAPFYGMELRVEPGVFIPRFETESLVEGAVQVLQRAARAAAGECDANPDGERVKHSRETETQFRILDLCTGSGAIALALARSLPKSQVIGVEKSEPAARIAAANAARFAPERAHIARADIHTLLTADTFPTPELSPLCDMHAPALTFTPGTLDLIVSNPPYVDPADIPTQAEARFDPPEALYAPDHGYAFIRTIEQIARRWLRPGGFCLIEHSEKQADSVRELFSRTPWSTAETCLDLTGRPRFVRAQKENT